MLGTVGSAVRTETTGDLAITGLILAENLTNDPHSGPYLAGGRCDV